MKTKSDSVRRDFSSKDQGCRVGRSRGRRGGVHYHRPVAFSTRSASPSRGRQNEFSFMERSKQCWKEPGVGRWEERVARRNRGSENVPEASLSSRGAACRLRQGRAEVPGLEEEERRNQSLAEMRRALMGQWGQAVQLNIYEAKNENLEHLCLALAQVHESCLSRMGKEDPLQ